MQLFLCLCALLASGAWATTEGVKEENFLRIWPENAMVEYEGSFVLNCSSNCNIGLETNLNKHLEGDGPTWKAYLLTNVNEWEPRPLCYATCENGKLLDQSPTITVYRAPERVELDSLPKVEVGKEYNLTCRVFNVAPIRKLTITFYKGKEELYVETYEGHSNPGADNIVVTHRVVTARQEDHREEVTCRATLDLRPEGPLFEKTSHNKSIAIVVFPKEPYLQTLGSVEINTNMTVMCAASGLFPAEDAEFELSFAGKMIYSSVHLSGDTASAMAQVSSTVPGQHTLLCRISLGPVVKAVHATVNVYSLPQPTLHIDQLQIPVNTTVTVTCRTDEFMSPGVIMQIADAKEILVQEGSPSLQYSLTAREEDDGRQFVCKVELEVDGHTVVKETPANLTVFYPPHLSDSSCPSQLFWKDGSEETFICSASGNPPPFVQCTKEEVSYKIGVQQQVRKEHGGTYHCNASNAYGFEAKDVTVHVESFQLNTLAISLAVLGVVVISSVAGVAYYMYYKSHKIRKYHLKRRQQPAGKPIEQKCLNGSV